ncbi:hypothetical protein MCUN1_000257 [Malassezia cuniculi]|uniref:DNA polymerase delta subunit 3 n=1 Tax=Malassezia cuniculi TaxID=948313 RepID=A0AAF0ER81_9BASI|nr:hypothetical protein MCUN1_000257 [Malassezia cuniculi]
MAHDAHTFLLARAHDRLAVTYALLAGRTGISAKEAQAALVRFASGRDDVHLVYAVVTKGPSGTRVALTAADALDGASDHYAYALQPVAQPDAALLAAAGREVLCDGSIPRPSGDGAGQQQAAHNNSRDGAPRKKRKVIRRERVKNEKGYTVTRDVEVYESCSDEDETKPAPAQAGTKPAAAATDAAAQPARAPARPPAAPKTSKAPKQSSLSSFFSKK